MQQKEEKSTLRAYFALNAQDTDAANMNYCFLAWISRFFLPIYFLLTNRNLKKFQMQAKNVTSPTSMSTPRAPGKKGPITSQAMGVFRLPPFSKSE